jgi:hypothetical protein
VSDLKRELTERTTYEAGATGIHPGCSACSVKVVSVEPVAVSVSGGGSRRDLRTCFAKVDRFADLVPQDVNVRWLFGPAGFTGADRQDGVPSGLIRWTPKNLREHALKHLSPRRWLMEMTVLKQLSCQSCGLLGLLSVSAIRFQSGRVLFEVTFEMVADLFGVLCCSVDEAGASSPEDVEASDVEAR